MRQRSRHYPNRNSEARVTIIPTLSLPALQVACQCAERWGASSLWGTVVLEPQLGMILATLTAIIVT